MAYWLSLPFMDHRHLYLPNGMQLVFKQVPATEIGHAGLVINAGSRDEAETEWGLAHFLEHMLFKGTRKRKAYHVLSRLDAVGGDLNAYTTRERTCLHASFRQIHAERALELLADIYFDASFPENELQREREVVLEEIRMYADEHDESILDEFESLAFANHPLGRPILGSEATLKAFTRQRLIDFKTAHYHAAHTVLSYVGPMSWPAFEKKLLPLFLRPLVGFQKERLPVPAYQPFQVEVPKPAQSAYAVLGNRAYAVGDDRRLGLLLLNNLLGGENMNSRLNMSIRERNGLVYGIESNYAPYTDTGLFFIYFSTEEKKLARVQRLVHAELHKLRQGISGLQLHLAKQQFVSRLLMAEENRSGLMLALGHSLLDHGRIDPLADIIAKIEALTANEITEIARDIFEPQQLSSLLYLPR
jgi:predicted Zn-dependent peptidase